MQQQVYSTGIQIYTHFKECFQHIYHKHFTFEMTHLRGIALQKERWLIQVEGEILRIMFNIQFDLKREHEKTLLDFKNLRNQIHFSIFGSFLTHSNEITSIALH